MELIILINIYKQTKGEGKKIIADIPMPKFPYKI